MSFLRDDEGGFELDEEAGCWLRDGAVHVKMVTTYGDPVELNAAQARAFAAAILRFAQALDRDE